MNPIDIKRVEDKLHCELARQKKVVDLQRTRKEQLIVGSEQIRKLHEQINSGYVHMNNKELLVQKAADVQKENVS